MLSDSQKHAEHIFSAIIIFIYLLISLALAIHLPFQLMP